MPECRHQVICGRNGGESTEEGLCILHSHNLGKDKQLFVKALEDHQKNKGHDFSFFVFPLFKADELAIPLTVYGWVVVTVESILVRPPFPWAFCLSCSATLKALK